MKSRFQKIAFVVIFLFLTFSNIGAIYYNGYGVIWAETDNSGYWKMRYREWDGNSWSTDEFGDDYIIWGDGGHHYFPLLQYDLEGRPVISFVDAGYDNMMAGHWNGTAWDMFVLDSLQIGDQRTANPDTVGGVSDWFGYIPKMETAPNGRVGVTWVEFDGGYWEARFREWDGTRWSDENDYYSPGYNSYKVYDPGNNHKYSPNILYTLDSKPIVEFFYANDYYYYVNIWTGTRWLNLGQNNMYSYSNGYDGARWFHMARAPDGRIGFVWTYYSGGYRSRYQVWNGRLPYSKLGDNWIHYTANTYAHFNVYDNNNNQYIGYGHDNGNIYTFKRLAGNNGGGRMDEDGSYLGGWTASTIWSDYRIHMAAAPNDKVGMVYATDTNGGGYRRVQFREHDGSSWTTTEYGGDPFYRIDTIHHGNQNHPWMIYDNNSYPVVIYEAAVNDGDTYVARWDGDSWEYTLMDSTNNGVCTQSAVLWPKIVKLERNLVVTPVGDTGLWLESVKINVTNNDTGVLEAEDTSHFGGNRDFLVDNTQSHIVCTKPYGPCVHGVRVHQNIFLHAYDSYKEQAPQLTVVTDVWGNAVQNKTIYGYYTDSCNLAFSVETNDWGIVNVSLDTSKTYDLYVEDRWYRNIRPPFTLYARHGDHSQQTQVPVLLSVPGELDYVNNSATEAGSLKVTVKDSDNNILWGPYTFNGSIDEGKFSLLVGGTYSLNLFSRETYTLTLSVCDKASFLEEAGSCISGSSHFDEFSLSFTLDADGSVREKCWEPTQFFIHGNDDIGRKWSNGAVARSCRHYRFPDHNDYVYMGDVGDGLYWIDPDGEHTGSYGPLKVYCDMTTEGGGWTFFGHYNQDTNAGEFFVTDTGTYRYDRQDDETTYSYGFVNELDDTEMMVTLDTTDPIEADKQSKILFYRYSDGHAGFNNGPIGCSGLSGYEYKTKIGGRYLPDGTNYYCDNTYWYSRTADNEAYLTMFINSGNYGNYWGTGMGGDNSWYHDGYWYVR